MGFARPRATTLEDRRQLLTETYANIAYGIFVALVALLPLSYLANGTGSLQTPVSDIIVYLLSHFGLILLLILKRIHAIVSYELRVTNLSE